MQWGAGADGCPELHLPTNGRHRRTREVVSHLKLVGDAAEARPHIRLARRVEGAPVAPGNTGGAFARVEGWSGGPIAQAQARCGDSGDERGEGWDTATAEAIWEGGLHFAVMAEAPERSPCRRRRALVTRWAEGTHTQRRQGPGKTYH